GVNLEYLTVKEVAELKGCSVRYIQSCVSKGKIESVRERSADNNCIQYKIPVSSLSEELKEKYYKQQRENLGLLPELKAAPEPKDTTPLKQRKNTVKKALDEYSEEERERIAFWIKTLKDWQAARAKFKRKTDADPLFCAKVRFENPEVDISPDILYRKYRAYMNNDYEGIVGKRGGWNSGNSCIDETVWSIFTAYYMTQHRLSAENCRNKAAAVCREYYPELADGIPSARTFRRRVEAEIPKAVLCYARKGEKEFLDNYLEYAERSLKNVKCNDIWISDNHTLDFFTLSDDGKVHRPSITTYQDAKSGVIVAAELCDHPNSDTTLLSLRSAALNGFGLPLALYFDNGSEYTASDVAGRGHRKQSQWQKNRDHPLQIFTLLGIAVTNAIPKNARAKPIERFFYTFKEHYSKSVESYCGGKPDERPEECQRLIKEGKLITDEEVRKLLPEFIKGHNSELYGGKERQYKNKRRIDVWNEAVMSGDVEFRTSDEENLRLLMRRTTGYQQIKRNGVYITVAGEKRWYNDRNTVLHVGEEVFVRYDPADLKEVQLYDKATGRFAYTYYAADYLHTEFIGENKENIQTLMRSQRQNRRLVKEQAKEYRKFDAVSYLQAELLRVRQLSENYEVAKPSEFTAVSADENINAVNITKIEFADIERLNDIRTRSRGA
ncbi:MAG: Mu transposase C-terminal domain-containing protein, partial [Ruminococcus sp.]|nr:Mu transposase C-terminal domain-containing protein [Ruminococcus sp.]